MTADTLHNKKLNKIVTEWFIRRRKLNTSVVFIIHFATPKDIKLNFVDYFIMKMSNKREKQFAYYHSSDINFRDFLNPYKKYTANPYSFFIIDTTLASDNSSSFRKNKL